MFRQLFKILILAIAAVLSGCASTKPAQDGGARNENLIIYYDAEAGNGDLLKAAEKYGSRVLYVYKNINGIAVTVPNGRTVTDAVKYYEKVKGVLSVTQDRKMYLD